ncbi:MAG: hypothetical protein KAJ05_04420 [Candidatus Latescibacteria bacterium]|nr:hypothetical protein [Candidatus Latescibacterota bacterium]
MQPSRLFRIVMLSAWMLFLGSGRAFAEIETWGVGEERSWGAWGTLEAMVDSGGWIRP